MNAQITRIELFMNRRCQSNKYSAGDWRIRRLQLCKIIPLHGYIRKHGGVKILLLTLGGFFFLFQYLLLLNLSAQQHMEDVGPQTVLGIGHQLPPPAHSSPESVPKTPGTGQSQRGRGAGVSCLST